MTSNNPDKPDIVNSLITNIPPPSALPTFVTNQMPQQVLTPPTSCTNVISTENTVDKQLQNSSQIEDAIVTNHEVENVSQSGANTDKSSVHSENEFTDPVLPPAITSQPLSPSSEGVQMPADWPNTCDDAKNDWIGWIKGTVQSVGSKVAEKAKTSMDTMITTLDPQMKDFINSGGDIDIVVASDKEVKISAVKEAFQKVFGKATVSGQSCQSSSVAAQPVGFIAALKSAEERINCVRNSGKVHPQQTVISVENFVVELFPDGWFEMGLLLLDDPWHDVILQTYTQTTPVPPEYIGEAKSLTKDDYEFKDTGFSETIGKIASNHLNVSHTMWQENFTGVSRRESILLAARALAGLYQARLPKDVI